MSEPTGERCQHGFADLADGPVHEAAGGVPHCTGPTDVTCWCEPEVLTPCRHCEAEPGPDPQPNRDAYLPPCEACGGSGMMPTDGTEAADDQLFLIHRDV